MNLDAGLRRMTNFTRLKTGNFNPMRNYSAPIKIICVHARELRKRLPASCSAGAVRSNRNIKASFLDAGRFTSPLTF